ncbi:MAG: excinuclease ABC subunit UvrA [Fuerstiella sp.]|nr:excinuclease ABC subunit UvrA [Fuerstiella sp.]
MQPNSIRIRGARTHNLRCIDVDIPLRQMTVITGLSGSGKSSLAHDTMFAEGQRRYLESVSIPSHQVIRAIRRPDVDEVSGMPPTVSVDQRVSLVPARSTVAVTTEIYDYLRLLYARCGVVHCTTCHRPVQCRTIDEIVCQVMRYPDRTRFMLLAPLVHDCRGSHQQVLERVARHGLVRVRIDGELFDLGDVTDLDASQKHSVDAVIDRLILKDGVKSRLHESISLAIRESGGACIVSVQRDGEWHDHCFNTRHECPECGVGYPEPDPGIFSFSSGRGACSRCEGLGVEGVADDSEDITVFRKKICAACGGTRLQRLASGVCFGDMTLPDFTALSVSRAQSVVQQWQGSLMESEQSPPEGFTIRSESRAAALRILPDLSRRLAGLARTGLKYLTLNRSTQSLSGGEYQRCRLAGCLATNIHGACYLLDEPTSGLHPQDTQQLLNILFELRDAGATLVVVEHDPEVISGADHLIEIGPGAGAEGGQLLYSGPPAARSGATPTDRMLNDPFKRVSPVESAVGNTPEDNVTVRGARTHNLQDVTVSIPLNRFVCVTGVSGSGKSSLIKDTVYPLVRASCDSLRQIKTTLADVECRDIEGLENVERVIFVDSRPVGRNRRSCLATHCGVWNEVRKLFARTREARSRGLAAGQFSFNTGSGRCTLCKGTGIQEFRMSLLPDAEVPCPECHGRRFGSEVLHVQFGGLTVHDVLNLRVDQALHVFSEINSVVRRLVPFQQVGLGYLTLGQPTATYSGGEAQRVRLAAELHESVDRKTLCILDEPTRGLHESDVERLLNILRGLVDCGHSAIVIEHNIQVIRAADWIIDMGPGAASQGGTVVAEGTPESLHDNPNSVTGRWL